ncbi:nucleotidyltransferase domain-containing protein [Candidatus Woesearchaeota archaeon]|nr:nucleotidyltransferase domain-containing protein [Candidatus Woesearchaeota archaeon]
MLDIFSDLSPFFEDSYRRIHVREYARLKAISPPSASRKLDGLHNEGLLKRERDRGYIRYYSNRDSRIFVHLSRIFWMERLRMTGLLDELEKGFVSPVIILFGSVSKAEITQRSDIDIAVFSPTQKKPELARFEKRLKRRIQLFTFRSKDEAPTELLNSILNGHIISGAW